MLGNARIDLIWESDCVKRLIVLVVAMACTLGLVACGANKYTCRPLDDTEKLDLQSSSLNEPFVTDEERDELLNRAVEKYLNSLDNNSVSFTYEITDTHSGFVNKDREKSKLFL